MNGKKLIFLLGAVLVVLVGGLFLLKGLDLESADPADVPDTIVLARVGEVTSFVQNLDGVTTTLERAETGTWVCMEDDTLALNQTVTESLTTAAAAPTAEQLVTDDTSRLSEFGLKSPACTVTITGTDGTYTLDIGSYQSFNQTYYVRLSDQSAVYALSASVAEQFLLPRESLCAAETVE